MKKPNSANYSTTVRTKRSLFTRIVPKTGALNLLCSALVLGYSAAFVISGDIPGYAGAAAAGNILLSLVTINLLALFIESISCSFIPLKRMLSWLTVILLTGFMSYHLSSKGAVDPSLVADNFDLMGSSESFLVVGSAFGLPLLLVWASVSAAAVILELKFSLFSRTAQTKYYTPKIVLSSVLYAAAMFSPFPSDDLTLFAKGFLLRGSEASASVPQDREYPYIRTFSGRGSDIPSGAEKPNIILVMVESFNANFAETSSPEGTVYTPVFNSLINRGLYIDRFYGNSIQTCKGQEATFFSILPSSKGKIFVDYQKTSLLGFPGVLAENGYRTVFFQGYDNFAFDNTRDGMKRAGFNAAYRFRDFSKPEDRSYIWGWGAEDHVFYKRFFDMLDREHSRNPGAPLFAALATIGTHIPCEGMPKGREPIYPEPKNLKERYANALRLSDSALAGFLEMIQSRPYLANTVIIITADHSFPMREHKIYNNEICHYEESFRIPFLLIWDGVIKPERISGHPCSQMDIAPTVLELAGIKKGEYPFQGISIFDRKSAHPVYLVQPYNGKFLETVRYPFKFVRHESTGENEFYNLADDPGESTKLSSVPENIKALFAKDLQYMKRNQALIENDRVWKKQQ